METLLLRPHPQRGPVFIREIQGIAWILSPHSPLDTLNETEITAEILELLEVINHSPAANLIVDLQQEEFVVSLFLGAVVRLWKRVGERGGRLVMCNVSDNVSQVLRVTKLHALWPIHGSREDALHALGM
ncbi:MAG TPA: STAS domain-containing protein [Planctomycetaceae bacterium]|nr:STAS domain-containing protein [Planctomycetaceae bacterium]